MLLSSSLHTVSMLYILEKQTDAGLSTEATFGACVGSTGKNENDSAGNLYIDYTSDTSKIAHKSTCFIKVFTISLTWKINSLLLHI